MKARFIISIILLCLGFIAAILPQKKKTIKFNENMNTLRVKIHKYQLKNQQ